MGAIFDPLTYPGGGAEGYHGTHMVTQKKVRRLEVISVILSVQGIRLDREQSHIRFFVRKTLIFLKSCATCSELPSNIVTMLNIATSLIFLFRKRSESERGLRNISSV